MNCDKCGAPVTYRENHPIGLPPRYDMSEQLKAKDERIKELQAEIGIWRESEGSVCPEDVGFVEYIKVLEGKVGWLLIGKPFAEWQKTAILETLKLTRGRRDKAAKMLKISLRTFYRRLSELGIRKWPEPIPRDDRGGACKSK